MATRNSAFIHRDPFANEPQVEPGLITGPVSALNPTQAHALLPVDGSSSSSDARDQAVQSSAAFKWTSRNNRKGRHLLAISPEADASAIPTPAPTNSLPSILRGIVRLFTTFPVWDISYDVAVLFTIGSVIWVINGFFIFLPDVRPSSEFDGEILYGGGITAFIGATIFEVGSILLMLEAVNENRESCFGWAVEVALAKHSNDHGNTTKGEIDNSSLVVEVHRDTEGCLHHHANKRNFVGKPRSEAMSAAQKTQDDSNDLQKNQSTARSWQWWPARSEYSHYFHELGFLACFSQFIGATVFWISGFTALPGIYDHMSSNLITGIYWTPQVVGAVGFVISGTLFMLETQRKWYIPAFGVLGWHIGLWNLIGAIGFLLSPAFGYSSRSWAQYQAGCSTFWGSWAFLIGSTIQWYESLEKHPVVVESLDHLSDGGVKGQA